MNSYTIYILKVCLGISIFAIAYYFFLRKDTALRLKRFFLLGGLFIAFLIPLLALKSPEIIEYSVPVIETETLQMVPDETIIAPEIPETSPINWPTVLIALYFCGGLILLFRNVFLILKWNNVWKNAGRKEKGVAWSANDEIIAVFSRIFLPESLKDTDEINSVLLHEKAHVRQMHFIDLIIMEMVMLVTWFNPFTWLFARMLKENHEHLADREALVGGADPTQYRVQLLNQTMGAQVFSLSQQFNNSFITNRFEMMKKSPSIRSGIIKTAILIPVILISLGFAVGKARQSTTISGKVVFADTGEPAFGASIVVKNSTTGTVAGKKGEYTLELKEKAEVVFSFVGYKSQSHWFAPGEYRLVALEREVIPLMGSNPSIPAGENILQRIDRTGSYPGLATMDESKKVIMIDGFIRTSKDLDNLDVKEVKRTQVRGLSDVEKKNYQEGKEVLISVTTKSYQGNISESDSNELRSSEDKKAGYRIQIQSYDSTKMISPFRIIIEPNENEVKLTSLSGCSWKNLSFSLKVGDSQAVDQFGMTSIENANAQKDEKFPDFLFIITKNKNEFLIDGRKGTKWKSVSFRIDESKWLLNHNGIFPTGNSGTSQISTFEAKDTTDGEVFFIVEEMPKFNGGDPATEFRKFIFQNLRYPLAAAQNGISGRVIVQFVINSKGMLVKPKVVVSVDPALDAEAIRVVSESPLWTPGKQRGKEVGVMYTFPINFALQKTQETTTPQAKPADSLRKENNPDKTQAVFKPSNEEVVFYIVEEMPKFNGGEPSQEFRKYIHGNLVYPEAEKKNKTTARTIVEFTVSETGKVTNVKVVTSSSEAFDKEAIRVIEESPLWTPGKQRGKAVSVKYTYPVNFVFE